MTTSVCISQPVLATFLVFWTDILQSTFIFLLPYKHDLRFCIIGKQFEIRTHTFRILIGQNDIRYFSIFFIVLLCSKYCTYRNVSKSIRSSVHTYSQISLLEKLTRAEELTDTVSFFLLGLQNLIYNSSLERCYNHKNYLQRNLAVL